jgi:uncharacterized protein
MSVSQSLYRLQTLDIAIAQRRARLKEIEAALGENAAVSQARQLLETVDKSLKTWQTRTRNLELEIKTIADKVKTTDQSLYSGKVRNPKELQEMQGEIAALQRQQRKLEDSLLEAMVESESAQAEVADAQQALSRAQTAYAGSQSNLVSEKETLEAEVGKLTTQRQQAAAEIDRAALSTYETLRPRKQGRPVALLKGDSCTVCGVEQTSVIAQQVRQGNMLVYCASCGRILATR